MAALLDIPPSSYQYYERGYDRARLPLELSARVRPVLLDHGIAAREIDRVCATAEGTAGLAPVSWAPLVTWRDVMSWPNDVGGKMSDAQLLPVPGPTRENLIALRVNDDDMTSIAAPGAYVVVDWKDAALVDGCAYLVRDGGRAWLRRYAAAERRLVADRPGRPSFETPCDVVGRVVYVVRSL